MSAHARFSPSKLSRIIACPASVSLSESLPSEPQSSAYAEEGTILHDLARQALELWPHRMLDSEFKDTEQQTLVYQAVGEVTKYLDNAPNATLLQDLHVAMRDIECSGTLDVALILEDTLEIHVMDFKFGAGIKVEVTNNPQLMAYLSGFLAKAQERCLLAQDLDMYELYIHIIQPRLDHHPAEQVFPEELTTFSARVRKAITLAEAKHPPFHPSTDACRWCPAGGVCRSRHQAMMHDVTLVFQSCADDDAPALHTQDNAFLAKLLSTKKRANDAYNAIEQHLLAQAAMGKTIPGYKLAYGRTNRRWADDVDAFLLSEAFGIEPADCMESKLKSPAQLEKLLSKADRARLVSEGLVTQPQGAPALVPESSDKAAISDAKTLASLADQG